MTFDEELEERVHGGHLRSAERPRQGATWPVELTKGAGGTDNGPPGLRDTAEGYPPGYYAAFVLDPDGNNIEAVFRGG
ncbi:MAG TPA: hypothetical protein VK762_07980 [Polyangiaceae bacterium]|nr:hypothetical protein [Polyangiaceae bacterium]